MNAQHTPEPWHLAVTNDTHVVDKDENAVANCNAMIADLSIEGVRMPDKIIWSEDTNWMQRDQTAKQAIEASPYRNQFMTVLGQFEAQLNQHETIRVMWWVNKWIYIEVSSARWNHYPCNKRALVSFDLSDGQFGSYLSDRHYAFARKGWGRFMDDLLHYKVSRYLDCDCPDKTTYC